MPQSKRQTFCTALLVLLATTIALINAPAEILRQVIVSCSPADLDKIRSAAGAAVVDAIPGYFLINVPSSVDTATIEHVPGANVEASENGPVFIPRTGRPTTGTSLSGGTPSLGSIVDWYGAPARQGYRDQTVVEKIALKQALNLATGAGVKVALIDTGVDLEHPALQGVFSGGTSYVGYTASPYFANDTSMPQLSQSSSNFLEQSSSNFLEQSSSNFLEQSSSNFLEQSSSNFLEQSFSNFLEQSSSNFLEQSSSNFLEQASSGVFLNQSSSNFLEGTSVPLFISHGTLMAGLIHLVAPRAQITPIAAFHVTGVTSEWNIVRAIYAAVQSGNQVINMSFETARRSKAMQRAIQDALSRGIVVVASAGNDSSEVRTYPGSFDGVIRVAALRDDNDQIASFSNYATDIGVSATGTRLISTWVGGHWGMVSGTSPAAALVSGEVALVKQSGSNGNRVESRVDSIDWPAQYQHKLGKGRINAFKAVSPGGDN